MKEMLIGCTLHFFIYFPRYRIGYSQIRMSVLDHSFSLSGIMAVTPAVNSMPVTKEKSQAEHGCKD